MIIGIDIDNVIADSESKFRNKLNNSYGLALKRKDIKTFNFYECTPITKEQEKKALDEFEAEGEYKKLRLIQFSKKCINILFKKNTIILITSRPERVKKDTEMWLQKRKIPYNKIVFSKNKSLYYKNFDIVIEDKWENAFEIAKKGTEVILLDYPWNRKSIELENIFRVKNWKEILELIENKEIKKIKKN